MESRAKTGSQSRCTAQTSKRVHRRRQARHPCSMTMLFPEGNPLEFEGIECGVPWLWSQFVRQSSVAEAWGGDSWRGWPS